MQMHFQMRQKMETLKVSKEAKIQMVQQKARECGVVEADKVLWRAVYTICRSETMMGFFLGCTTPEGRLDFIKMTAGVDN
ncbi:unnamed protein product [Urochloa humidicola]